MHSPRPFPFPPPRQRYGPMTDRISTASWSGDLVPSAIPGSFVNVRHEGPPPLPFQHWVNQAFTFPSQGSPSFALLPPKFHRFCLRACRSLANSFLFSCAFPHRFKARHREPRPSMIMIIHNLLTQFPPLGSQVHKCWRIPNYTHLSFFQNHSAYPPTGGVQT